MALACMVKNRNKLLVFSDDVTPGDVYTTVLSAQIKQNPARISQGNEIGYCSIDTSVT